MVVPEPFKIHSPEGNYTVDFDIDLDSLSFPIICHPNSFKREIIQFLNTVPNKANYYINMMLIEKSPNTHNVLPLNVRITFFEHDLDQNMEEDSSENLDHILQFRQFIQQLSANGELDYLLSADKNSQD